VLTPEGLARLLNMPLSWIYERTRRGEIPGFKVGKYWRFRENEVLAWFEQFRQGPKPMEMEAQSAYSSEGDTSTGMALDGNGAGRRPQPALRKYVVGEK
jgi:excisionase family DNA binding protein